MDRVKICPRCKAEYYPDILQCADCGVALVWPAAKPVVARPEVEQLEEDEWWGIRSQPKVQKDDDGWDQFEDTEILGQLASDVGKIIRIYRATLLEAGIPAAQLPNTRYREGRHLPVGYLDEGFENILFVRKDDMKAAEHIVEELFTNLHPDLPGGLNLEFAEGQCPACGAAIPDDATECPDCGLPFTAD